MLHRLLSYLSFNALATLAGLLRRRRYDVILAPNGSFFTGLAAALIGAARGTPFVYNVQDLYPEVPVQAGQLSNRHAIEGLRRLEQLMYRLAARVSLIAPGFRANLLGKGVPAPKLALIPNFVDTERIRPLPRRNSFSAAHGLDEQFVVSYAGNLGYVYDLHSVLEAAALLRHRLDILFLIVGEGVCKAELQAHAASLGLANLRFLPFQPAEDLPLMRAAVDVQLSPHRPGTTGYSLPSKVYEIMASGRPLVVAADPGSDLATLVETAGCGLALPPGDPARLAQAILALRADPALREAMGAAGRRYAERHFAPAVVVEQYEALLGAVAHEQRTSRSSRSKSVPALYRRDAERVE
jgi:colanic acid biosynthesis glycosyl transferase WcaI